MIAVIELKEELYVVTFVGDYRPVVKTYYRQSSFGNVFRGRRFDLIVLKNVDLTEEAQRVMTPCLAPSGRFLTIGSKFPAGQWEKRCQEMEEALGVYQNSPEWVRVKHEGEKLKLEAKKLDAIRPLNNALYEALPSGKVDAFELINLIKSHYEQVAEVLE